MDGAEVGETVCTKCACYAVLTPEAIDTGQTPGCGGHLAWASVPCAQQLGMPLAHVLAGTQRYVGCTPSPYWRGAPAPSPSPRTPHPSHPPGQYVPQELSKALEAVVAYTLMLSGSTPSNMEPLSHACGGGGTQCRRLIPHHRYAQPAHSRLTAPGLVLTSRGAPCAIARYAVAVALSL